jgi:hypothetical protein
VIPIMVSSLVVIFAVVELLLLPLLAQHALYTEPMVAGAWMGLAVKTDGAAVASGAITDSLIRGRALIDGIRYQPDWIMGATATVKVFIDVFIGVWAFILAIIWATFIDRKQGEKVQAREIWERAPKFVFGYVMTFAIVLAIALPASRRITSLGAETTGLEKQLAAAQAKLATTTDPAAVAALNGEIATAQGAMSEAKTKLAAAKDTISSAKLGTGEAKLFQGLFFVMTFFTIGVVSNFRKLWEEGIGKLAAVYVICLFGFIIWVGLAISWIFFHGVKPPLVS